MDGSVGFETKYENCHESPVYEEASLLTQKHLNLIY
jgi:hypothetical protein